MASILPPAPHPSPGAAAWTCPDCRRPLVPQMGCALCPSCGWSPCG